MQFSDTDSRKFMRTYYGIRNIREYERMKQKIGILGAGAWGTALAQTAAKVHNSVQLWTRKESHAHMLTKTRINQLYLPHLPLHHNITATSQLHQMKTCDALYIAIPSQFLSSFFSDLQEVGLLADVPLILCSKGIDIASGTYLSTHLNNAFPTHPFGILSGPTFASEVAMGLPAAVVIASETPQICRAVSHTFEGGGLRFYFSNDIVGVEIAGAVKNVIAIACGIVAGRQMGENARAALITRGLSEMTQLSYKCGGHIETMMGLAGIGDLTLTCNAQQSRNFSFGMSLGRGENQQWDIGQRMTVVEGAHASISVTNLARLKQVEMPICEAVRSIIHDQADIDETITQMLQRPLRHEDGHSDKNILPPA